MEGKTNIRPCICVVINVVTRRSNKAITLSTTKLQSVHFDLSIGSLSNRSSFQYYSSSILLQVIFFLIQTAVNHRPELTSLEC